MGLGEDMSMFPILRIDPIFNSGKDLGGFSFLIGTPVSPPNSCCEKPFNYISQLKESQRLF